jgi:hypothetical protein
LESSKPQVTIARMAFSELKVTISRIWPDKSTSMENLQPHDPLYGDLQTLVEPRILPGTEPIGSGQRSFRLELRELMRLRRLRKPVKYSTEFVELSGYKYDFEFLAEQRPQVLMLSVKHERKPVVDFERIGFEFDETREHLTDFRHHIHQILLKSCPLEIATRWWEGACYEYFDDAKNHPRK